MDGLPGSALATFGALVAVLVLAWLLLRGLSALMRRGGAVAARGESLRVRSSIAVGQRQRVVVVRWRERDYLLGVTASSVSRIDDREVAADDDPEASPGGRVGPAVSKGEPGSGPT